MNTGELIYITISFLLVLKLMFYLVAGLILLSGLDDLFIDLFYALRVLWRRVYTYQRHPPMAHPALDRQKENTFAVLIPCWQEAEVIGAMLENTRKSYDYEKYHLFVGLYPNDPASQREVERVTKNDKKVYACLLTHDGPTNKADCLNAVLKQVWNYEKDTGRQFAGFVLHDAEDIVHPLELKLFNHLIDRKDMIQLPVIPLERPWWDLTGAHYQDEFAENHSKELVVREALTGLVPCAGVGCAFSRRAFLKLLRQGDVFRPGSLTEDYDLSLRLKSLGCREIFVRFPFVGSRGQKHIIATREYFPNRMKDVIRQKSRWLIGIVFQSWRQQKWTGSLTFRYGLVRDRKGFFTAWLAMVAYFLLFGMLIYWGLGKTLLAGHDMPPLVMDGEPLEYLLWINLGLLLNRALHRMYFCARIYGPLCALFSLPRQVWGNILNFLAGFRAFRLYSLHLITGQPLTWDKTVHEFPAPQELEPFRARLGEMLLEKQLISENDLTEALLAQEVTPLLLGQILVSRQHIDQDVLDQLLDEQSGERPHVNEV
ncbi:glycosyl transferase family protein [Emcibacter sp.]|uniref:glycosyl transferase family protein n=1 Tax=Emcibacter sp. TaxID=1979954 RepID=UPI002AA81710|nr:glycosyl transferase family protein [Emcibacter sp.]